MYSLAASWCTNFVRTEDNEHRWFVIFGPPQSSLAAANLLLSRMELKTQDKLTMIYHLNHIIQNIQSSKLLRIICTQEIMQRRSF